MDRDSNEYMSAAIERYCRILSAIGPDDYALRRKLAIQRWKHKRRGAGGTLTVEEWNDKIKDGLCHWCGEETEDLTVDHVIPKAVGGGFTAENIAPACEPCNRLRGETTNYVLQALKEE